MTVSTVAIHDPKHPKTWYACKVTLDTVTILVDLALLRNEASASFNGQLFDQLGHLLLLSLIIQIYCCTCFIALICSLFSDASEI